jgi:imidazolonepropionase-like amidohydrolase
MKCAGQMICTTGGHGWSIGYQADGPVEIIKGVRTQIRSGVDVIKFMATSGVLTRGSKPGMPQLNPDELRAGIEEAHKASLKTAAHVQGIEGAWNAVRAGIDSIEHGVSLDDDIIREMIDRNVFLVPTLSAPFRILERGIQAKIPREYVEKTRRIKEAHVSSINRARQAGVKIAMGTDAGTPFNFHGENAMELCYMVENGFSETEAIVSATSRAAELLGSDTEVGRIAPGMKADLLVVEGNPLKSIKILGDPARITVYKNGKQVPDRNHTDENN